MNIDVMTILGSVMSTDDIGDINGDLVRYSFDVNVAKSIGIDTEDYECCDVYISMVSCEIVGIRLYDGEGRDKDIFWVSKDNVEMHIPDNYQYIYKILCRDLVCAVLPHYKF